MFYGDAAAASTQDMSFTPGKNIINDNIPALQKLLRYEAQKGNTGAGQTQPFMHARMSDNGAVTRGDALVDQVMGLLFFPQLGDDSSNKQRMNNTSHAYEVHGAHLADKTGAALALTSADLPARAADIDPEKSAVQMHTPHATTEPDMRGTGPAGGKDDGQFTYPLDQFLRCFDLLRMNDVSH